MREMTERLADGPRAGCRVPSGPRGLPDPPRCPRRAARSGCSAGGMPTRVKCLHVLVAHALAVGPGVNPLGDEALAMLPAWWTTDPA